MNSFPFTQFYVSLSIVLVGVALCIDWRAMIEKPIEWLVTCTEAVLFVVVVLPVNYLNKYKAPPGRHRRNNVRQPTDSEVDRWRGADDSFVDFLHTLNAEIHVNEQARA